MCMMYTRRTERFNEAPALLPGITDSDLVQWGGEGTRFNEAPALLPGITSLPVKGKVPAKALQ